MSDHQTAREVADSVSINECQALRHLSADGWSEEELMLAFERSNDTVHTHVSGECTHPDEAAPTPRPIPSPEELRTRRAEANLSQSEMADAVGVTTATVCKWETGKATPKRDRIPEIEAALEGYNTSKNTDMETR